MEPNDRIPLHQRTSILYPEPRVDLDRSEFKGAFGMTALLVIRKLSS